MNLICAGCGIEFQHKRKRKFHSSACANKTLIERRWDRINISPLKTVWSCGGGVDSTAIALLIIQGRLPKPDFAFMTDVGWERSSTWDYVTRTLSPRLREAGVHLHIIKTSVYMKTDLISPYGYVNIPAYRRHGDGSISKLHTRCSGPWKMHTAKRWLREQGIQLCENWVGIAADEERRAKESGQKWFTHRWPLIELGMTREDCLYAIGQAKWPKPPRTSCVMCPGQNNNEWKYMIKFEPEEFARACQIERDIQRQVPDTYLHPSCMPLSEWAGQDEWDGEEVDSSSRECNPFTQCTSF